MLTLLPSLYSNFFIIFSVALASIPDLPAETCKEIKASEFGQVVSGKYWFSGIKPREAVLAYCDIETEGESSYVTSPLRGVYKIPSLRLQLNGVFSSCVILDDKSPSLLQHHPYGIASTLCMRTPLSSG